MINPLSTTLPQTPPVHSNNQPLDSKNYLPVSDSEQSKIDIAARHVRRLPRITVTLQRTDQRYSDFDLSKQPLTTTLNQLTSSDAAKWVKKYTTLIAQGVTLSMPAMEETAAAMKALLQQFKTKYPLSPYEMAILDNFIDALDDNAERGYPNLASEQLALCFCHMRDFLLKQYTHLQSHEEPITCNAPYSASEDFNFSTLSAIAEIDWDQYYSNSIDRTPELEKNYFDTFKVPTVRVLCMDESIIQLFNQPFAPDITLIDVLNLSQLDNTAAA